MILKLQSSKLKYAAEFEAAFTIASSIISSMPGYISHELQRWSGSWKPIHPASALAETGRRLVSDNHRSIKMASPAPFYEPFPTVEHYERVSNRV